jgi:hypothetical protein
LRSFASCKWDRAVGIELGHQNPQKIFADHFGFFVGVGNHLPKWVQAVSTKTMVRVNTASHSNIGVSNHRESVLRIVHIDKSSEQNFYKPFVAYDPPFKATVLKNFKPIKKVLP